MVLISVLVITLILGIILISLGFHFKKRALFLSLAGSILFLIIGLNLFFSGLSVPNGSTQEDINSSVTITTIDYDNIQNTSITILSWVITLIGFAGFIGSSISLNKNRFDEGDDEAEDF